MSLSDLLAAIDSGRHHGNLSSAMRLFVLNFYWEQRKPHDDRRRGMHSLALQVQEVLKRNPHAGDLYVFRGRSGSLIKILWHDGIGMSLYAKRLERGRFIWPSAADGVVSISTSQLAYMLDGIDWRNPQHTWRPIAAG
jgi:transposase